MKRYWALFKKRKTYTKITLRYHLLPIRLAKIFKLDKIPCCQGCAESDTLINCECCTNTYSLQGDYFGSSKKIFLMHKSFGPAILLPEIHPTDELVHM